MPQLKAYSYVLGGFGEKKPEKKINTTEKYVNAMEERGWSDAKECRQPPEARKEKMILP